MDDTLVTLLALVFLLGLVAVVVGMLMAIPGTSLWHDMQHRRYLRRQRALTQQRIRAGAILRVYDDRFHLLMTARGAIPGDDWPFTLFRLHRDIEVWCDEFTPGWGYLSDEFPEGGIGVILFKHSDDAIAFKLRWY